MAHAVLEVELPETKEQSPRGQPNLIDVRFFALVSVCPRQLAHSYRLSSPRKEVRKIKSHYVYSSRSQPGSLVAVIMSMEFADGTDTGRGGYIDSEPYLPDASFRAALRRYVATKKGKTMHKYVPASVFEE